MVLPVRFSFLLLLNGFLFLFLIFRSFIKIQAISAFMWLLGLQ